MAYNELNSVQHYITEIRSGQLCMKVILPTDHTEENTKYKIKNSWLIAYRVAI
jgi:hypothetical protein